MAVTCKITGAHCRLMRAACFAYLKPGLPAVHLPVLKDLEEGRIIKFLAQAIRSELPDKLRLFEAAFYLRSDQPQLLDSLLVESNHQKDYKNTLALLKFLPEDQWTQTCHVTAFRAYSQLGYPREALNSYDRLEERYKTANLNCVAALCCARLNDFPRAMSILTQVPPAIRQDSRSALKVFQLRALQTEDSVVKTRVIELAASRRKLWDDEMRFLQAQLYLQTDCMAKALDLYFYFLDRPPQSLSRERYEGMFAVFMANEDYSKAKKTLISGNGVLSPKYMDEAAHKIAERYRQRNVHAELLAFCLELPDVNWKDKIHIRLAQICANNDRWEDVLKVCAKIPYPVWTDTTLKYFVRACSKLGREEDALALRDKFPAEIFDSALLSARQKDIFEREAVEQISTADALLKEQRYQEAREIFMSVKRKSWNNAFLYNYLVCLMALGMQTKAYNILHAWPKKLWDENLIALDARLTSQ